jgi:hypothetical protein
MQQVSAVARALRGLGAAATEEAMGAPRHPAAPRRRARALASGVGADDSGAGARERGRLGRRRALPQHLAGRGEGIPPARSRRPCLRFGSTPRAIANTTSSAVKRVTYGSRSSLIIRERVKAHRHILSSAPPTQTNVVPYSATAIGCVVDSPISVVKKGMTATSVRKRMLSRRRRTRGDIPD